MSKNPKETGELNDRPEMTDKPVPVQDTEEDGVPFIPERVRNAYKPVDGFWRNPDYWP
ncbi:hypothetical protein GCM10023063_18600 [Arthrobacter methylotrophus]